MGKRSSGAACGGSTKAPPSLPTPPTITSFKADSSQIDPGGSVTLSFTTENATEARIVDQTGAEIPFEGTASSGTVKVQPAATSFFVLRAKGDGGQDTAFVHVAVGEDLKQLKKVFPFEQNAVVDLGDIARRHGLRQSGVRSLAAVFLGIRIPKGSKTSNWAARRLSPQQITYAATDAWVCRQLYLRFEELGML